jgi:hypothetical protein
MKDWTSFFIINFKRTQSDPTIYIQVHANDNLNILAIYVDDGIVVTLNLVLDAKLRTLFEKEFEMTYEGNIHYVVGLQIIHNRIIFFL